MYLEAHFPDRPSLFGGPAGLALARFVNSWADTVLHPGIARLIVADVCAIVAERDRDYFRKTREERFGKPLEAVQASRADDVVVFRQSLQPLRATLEAQPYLGGDNANYADYIVFGGFQWPRVASAFPLLAGDDPIFRWRERLLDAFGGLARSMPAAAK